jgi:spermidine synthase
LDSSTPNSPPSPPFSLLAGLFLLSAALLTLEILESRIFAFVLWHHLGFMVISIAMLGLAAAGSALASRSNFFLARPRTMLEISALGFVVTLILGQALIARLPLTLNWTIIPGMAVLYLLAFLPFAFAGLGLVLPFRMYPGQAGQLYTVSMVGSGLGAFAALSGLSALGAERLLVAVALAAAAAGFWFASAPPRSVRHRVAWVALAGILVALFWVAEPFIHFQAFRSKLLGRYLTQNPTARIEATGWTPYCRIDVVDLGKDRMIFGEPLHIKPVFQDGDEPTNILLADRNPNLYYMNELSPFIAGYLLQPRPEKMLILGPGGGFEVLLALRRRVPDITAVEINPFTIRMVRGPYGPEDGRVYDQPSVRLVNAEGRAFLSRSREKFDLITLNGVDTYTSLASGAYVLTESYLYTQEAMADYLDHLTDHGVLAFYRFLQLPPRESLRLVVVMVQAMHRRGIAHPEEHLAILVSGTVCFNLLVKKDPFTAAEVEALRRQVDSYDYRIEVNDPVTLMKADRFPRRIVYAPGLAGKDEFSRYLAAVREGKEAEFLDRYPFDLAGVTDDSPYFFKYPLLDMFMLGPKLTLGPVLILAQIVQTGILAVFLVLWPLRRLPKAAVRPRQAMRSLLYFAGVGLGYLFIEIALMQKLVLFLGNPTYSLSVTLTALLISSGLGAMWIARHPNWRPGRWAALAVAVLVLVMLRAIPLLTHVWLSQNLPLRIVIAAAMIFPLGFGMGIPFPAGLRAISETSPDLVPWAWGANSAASVMAAILCVPIAMNTNFTTVLILAAGLYLAVAWADQTRPAPKSR